MADRIDQLPNQQENPNDIDLEAIRHLFGNSNTKIDVKKFIVPVILFLLLSLPMVDSLFKATISDSSIVLLFVKALVFLVILFIVQN
jgi:NADH:ubiquinone oxidoreductase subunit 3 (subunit A)